jgi:hypothetical protein
MAAPTATSLRGLTTQYFYYADHWFDGINGSYSKNEEVLEEGSHEEYSLYTAACFANAQWTAAIGSEHICMTYNPITDHYAIKEGEYVL